MKRLALCLLFACTSSAPAPQSPPPAPAPAPAPEPAPTETPPPEPAQVHPLGTPCADADGCSGKAKCVLYYGVAGQRGPQFRSCEIKCGADGDCPDEHRCVTIADGPGRVCRP